MATTQFITNILENQIDKIEPAEDEQIYQKLNIDDFVKLPDIQTITPTFY